MEERRAWPTTSLCRHAARPGWRRLGGGVSLQSITLGTAALPGGSAIWRPAAGIGGAPSPPAGSHPIRDPAGIGPDGDRIRLSIGGGVLCSSRLLPRTVLTTCELHLGGTRRVPAGRTAGPLARSPSHLCSPCPPHIPSGRRSAGRAPLTTRGLFSVPGTRFFGRSPRFRSLTGCSRPRRNLSTRGRP